VLRIASNNMLCTKYWWLTIVIVALGSCHCFPLPDEPTSEEEKIIDENSKACLDSAREVHGERDPNAELNHYLTCLMKKTRKEVLYSTFFVYKSCRQDNLVSSLQESKEPNSDESALQGASATLAKILDNPLFREDVDRKGRIVKRNAPPQLDEELVAALAR
jgi:hypothetical protein